VEVGFALAFDVIFRRRQPALLGPARLSLSRRSLSDPGHAAYSSGTLEIGMKKQCLLFSEFLFYLSRCRQAGKPVLLLRQPPFWT